MTESELLKDCLVRLNRLDIGYMLTGSMASNFWGIPRSTHDLDFVVQIPPSAIERVVKGFSGDFFLDEHSLRAAYRPPHQFNAIDRRSALKVDFWMSAGAPFEREMFRRRQHLPMLGEQAWVATAEDIILHKLLWNRISPSDRQLADAAGVWLVQRANLDLNYLHHWAVELDVQKSLQDLLDGKIKPKHT